MSHRTWAGFNILSLGAVAVSLAFIGYLSFLWFVDDLPPAVYYNHPFPVLTPVVVQEGILEIEVDLNKERGDPVKANLLWVNTRTGESFPGRELGITNSPPGRLTITPSYVVPELLPPGRYSLVFLMEAHTNWLRSTRYTSVKYVVRTDVFTVEAK